MHEPTLDDIDTALAHHWASYLDHCRTGAIGTAAQVMERIDEMLETRSNLVLIGGS